MALSFSEKRALQKTIADNLTTLASGSLGFSDKRKAQSVVMDGLKKLGETVIAIAETIFQQIHKGVHDSLGAMEVFSKIKSEVDRITREVIGGDSEINSQLLAACIQCAYLAESEGIA